MLGFHQPLYRIRAAEVYETSLIGYLRLTSLLSLEVPDRSLGAIRALMERLPDVSSDLIQSGQYFVADHDGELLGGAGWSVLPLRFGADVRTAARRASRSPAVRCCCAGSFSIRTLAAEAQALPCWLASRRRRRATATTPPN